MVTSSKSARCFGNISASESVKVNISKARRVLIGSLNSVVFQGSFCVMLSPTSLGVHCQTGHG